LAYTYIRAPETPPTSLKLSCDGWCDSHYWPQLDQTSTSWYICICSAVIDHDKKITGLRILTGWNVSPTQGKQGFFFFKIFKEADWWSPTRGMSQIWLDVRQWSRIFWKACLVLASTRNSLSKYGNMWLFFLKMWRLLLFFFPKKKSLCALRTGF
jgi:hypothetical protein